MDKADIRRLLEHKAHKIKKLCSRIMPEFDSEDIHKFRIEVKRLRAFLRFLETTPKQPKIKIPKRLKQLYDIAGVIRDRQLQLQNLQSIADNAPDYIAYIKRTIASQKREWEIYYSEKAIDKLEDNIKDADLHKLHDTSLSGFASKYITEIKNLMLDPPDEDSIHAVRKHVKDMLYNFKYAEEKWPKAMTRLHYIEMAQLDELANAIGSYHDDTVLIEHLNMFIITPHAQNELQTIENLITHKEEKQAKTRPDILQKINNFITAAVH